MGDKSLLVLLLLLVLPSCATTRFNIQVDAISDPSSFSGGSFVLMPAMEGEDGTSLQYREYERYIRHTLISNGYHESEDIMTADLAIFLSYGIGDPQTHQYSYSMPVRGQTGVSSATTNSTVQVFGNMGTVSSTTTYNPTYGIIGYRSYTGTNTTFFRFLVLDAIDMHEYRATESLTPAWRTTITSTGSSGDLRRVFPILVAAASPYIGKNTGQQVNVTLSDTDRRVLEIRAQSAQRQ